MYDEDIERAMLFYLIFEQEEYILDENDFVNYRNKRIIKAINELKAEKKEVSMLNIKTKIKANPQQVLEYIANLGEYVRTTNAEKIYNELIELSKKRKLFHLMQDRMTQLTECEDIDIFSQEIVKEINKLESVNEKEKTFLQQVVDVTIKMENDNKKGIDYSLYTGLQDLDDKICGLHKQELTIIGARPGIGKTTLALQIGEYIASKGIETAIISLEMSNIQVIQKMLSKKTRINSYKMRMGTLENEDWEKITNASVELTQLPIHLITSARTLQHIENIARKLKNKNNLGLLIIDYIQLIKNKGKFNNREQEVADITRTLKLLSLELDIPIVGLCQLNRNATRQEPMLADLRESGAIEQDADNVMFLYQEKEDDSNFVDVTLKIAKQRAGEIGKVYLKFNKIMNEFKGVIRC